MSSLRVVQATYVGVFALVFVSNLVLGPSRFAFLALAGVLALVGALLLGNILDVAKQQAEQAARGAWWAPPVFASVSANRALGAFFLLGSVVMSLMVINSDMPLLP